MLAGGAINRRWTEGPLARPVLSPCGIHWPGKNGIGLRACPYEFHYLPVANAFVKPIGAGADIKVIYDAGSTNNSRTSGRSVTPDSTTTT